CSQSSNWLGGCLPGPSGFANAAPGDLFQRVEASGSIVPPRNSDLLAFLAEVLIGLLARKDFAGPLLARRIEGKRLDTLAPQGHHTHPLPLAAALLGILGQEVELAEVRFQALPELDVADRLLAGVVDMSAVVLVD